MKPLVILQVLGRPKTTKDCINALIRTASKKDFDFCIVDQDSSSEVKKVIWSLSPDYMLTREFNSGIVFGINEAIAKYRKPGQTIIKLDDDVVLQTPGWLDLFQKVLDDSKIGSCLGRRPTFWIDAPGRLKYYIDMPKYEIDGIWVEESLGGLVGCWWAIKSQVIDKIGYLNEATQNDDADYFYRMLISGWKSVYIPDAVCYQPFDEKIDHPTYGIVKRLVQQQDQLANTYYMIYNDGRVHLPSRFKNDGEPRFYLKEAEKMWQEYRNETEKHCSKSVN